MSEDNNCLKVFIDCGAWEGISSLFFYNHHPQAKDFHCYAFECNPHIIQKLKDNISHFSHVIEAAVWTKPEKMPLYLGSGKYTESSSLIKEKRTGKLDKENPIYVDTVVFSRFLSKMFFETDCKKEVFCKMNIEGAEYSVLNQLIETGAIRYIDKLYIQWHWKKIGFPQENHDKLIKNLTRCGIEMYNWPLDHDDQLNIDPKFIKYFKKTL